MPSHLPLRVSGTHVDPDFFTPADHGWLRLLIEELQRFAGKPRHELDRFVAQGLPFAAPPLKLAFALEAERGAWRSNVMAAAPPKRIRARLFLAAAKEDTRANAINRTARELAISAAEVERAMFADLPGERLLQPPPETSTPQDLALRCNQRLVERLLLRSSRLSIRIEGNARRVVTHLKRCGLICSIRVGGGRSQQLEISGPLSVFHRTLLYGRALARLVPNMAWCNRWELEAEICLGELRRTLQLSTGAPIQPANEPPLYDSRLEARFAKDFRGALPEWDLVREPQAVPCGDTLIFPDFEIAHRHDPSRRWLLEVVGFWTAEYLERKLRCYREAELDRFILCVDAERQVSDDELPRAAEVIRYRKRINVGDVAEVLACGPTRRAQSTR